MAVHQAPPSLGFSRQEHWSGLPFPSPFGYILIPKSMSGSYSNSIFNFWRVLLAFFPQRERYSQRNGSYQIASPICVYSSQATLDLVFNLSVQQRVVSTMAPLHTWPLFPRAVSGCPWENCEMVHCLKSWG